MREITVHSLEETMTLGRSLGQSLFPGAVVGLIGPLGSGKTHFVRAVAEGLEIPDSRVVTSPTFVLIQEYNARLPIFHFDTYRLSKEVEFKDLGVDEYYTAGGVCLIEWADRVSASLPEERLEITIRIEGETTRVFGFCAYGAAHERLIPAVAV